MIFALRAIRTFALGPTWSSCLFLDKYLWSLRLQTSLARSATRVSHLIACLAILLGILPVIASRARQRTHSNAEAPVQRSQPLEASSPRTSSSPAASSLRVDAAPPASGEQNVDTAIVAIPPTGMELDSGAGAAGNLPSEDNTSTPQPKQLVVTISEFTESLAISHDFSCQREVSVVQRRSTNHDMTKRLQKPQSTAGAKKSFCLPVPAKGPPPAPSSSPHHAAVEHGVSDSVVPDTPPLSRCPGKITQTKHIREWRLLKSSRHRLVSLLPPLQWPSPSATLSKRL